MDESCMAGGAQPFGVQAPVSTQSGSEHRHSTATATATVSAQPQSQSQSQSRRVNRGDAIELQVRSQHSHSTVTEGESGITSYCKHRSALDRSPLTIHDSSHVAQCRYIPPNPPPPLPIPHRQVSPASSLGGSDGRGWLTDASYHSDPPMHWPQCPTPTTSRGCRRRR